MSAYARRIPESAKPISAPHGAGFLTRDEVMTAREVAELLRILTSTVYELAGEACFRPSRLGRTWRLLRPRLEELLAG